jgi:hypothetical protein
VKKLSKLASVQSVSQELVRFDMQLIQNPEVSGVEYQQGELQGYEVREYLLNISKILTQAKAPLKDAAAVNSTRWALANRLKDLGFQVELASGGKTKFNRVTQGMPKTHALDAVCVGEIGTGRGSYQRTRLNAYGFPRGYLTRKKAIKGFQTGDMVIATVPKGKKAGIHQGRVAVRASGSFNIKTTEGLVQGISHKYCKLIARSDGYGYLQQSKIALIEEVEKRAA